MGASTNYYRNHPEARKKKAVTDTKINERPEQIKKRTESNQKRADAKKTGKNIKSMDYDHSVNKFVPVATNRGRAGEGGRKTKSGGTSKK